MVREERSFDQAYRQFLPGEQRKQILNALREKLDPETTVGDVVDAAKTLGWDDELGQVLLAELADSLLDEDDIANDDDSTQAKHTPAELTRRAQNLQAAISERLANWDEDVEAAAWTAEESDDDELENDEDDTYDDTSDEDEAPVAARSGKKKSSKKSGKKSGKKSSKKSGKKSGKKSSKKSGKKSGKKSSKKSGKRRGR